jgi:hypothetical protein
MRESRSSDAALVQASLPWRGRPRIAVGAFRGRQIRNYLVHLLAVAENQVMANHPG